MKMAQLFGEYGRPDLAIECFHTQIGAAANDLRICDREVLQREFIKFAWRTAHASLVFPLADEMLREDPTDFAGLSVRMFQQITARESQPAKDTASAILRDPDADDFYHELSQLVLKGNGDYDKILGH